LYEKVDDKVGCVDLGKNNPLPLKLSIEKSFKNP